VGAVTKETPNRYFKPNHRKTVERILKKYPIYKTSMLKFPSCVTNLSYERVQGGYKEFQSTTEKFAIVHADRSRLVKQVDQSLELLEVEERKVIEETYFRSGWYQINIVWERLGMSKSTYYRKKQEILDKLAMLWGFL
jgi:ArpU family phage transcriptional regulator